MVTPFREALGYSESGGDYSAVNDLGYVGKYQWGQDRLDDYNKAYGTHFTLDDFKADPALQEHAQAWSEQDIMNYVMDNGLDYYLYKDVGGVTMTPEALMAMAHLGGKKGMMDFVLSGGQDNRQDAYGTSLRDYAEKFSDAQRRYDQRRLLEQSAEEQPAPEEELTFGDRAENFGKALTMYEMLSQSGDDFCPAGSVYDPVQQKCVDPSEMMNAVRRSPPKPRPADTSLVTGAGIPSLL